MNNGMSLELPQTAPHEAHTFHDQSDKQAIEQDLV
jgi:hypothetical protein